MNSYLEDMGLSKKRGQYTDEFPAFNVSLLR
jgi:hypothetical protein